MLAIPAIDLKEGRCVRLFQGDPERETVFSAEPPAVARRWERLGARLLHLVDLDGAFTGQSANSGAITAIGEAIGIPFQVGGGIRSREAVERALAAGAARVILGTVIVERPHTARELAVEFGERVVAGIDAREGVVAVKGWTASAGLRAVELACRVEQWGIREIIYTDIQRDGTLRGPDLRGLEELLSGSSLQIIVSGGISSLEDLRLLKPYAPRVSGVIIGQALYTNRFTLPEAVAALA